MTTLQLTDQMRQALEAERGAPEQIVDEQTKRVYYVISAEQFETVRAMYVDGEFQPRELYPLISKTVAQAAGTTHSWMSTTNTMSTGMKVSRGDVVLLPIAFVSGQGSKVRPAVVIQNDNLKSRLNSTVAAIITSTNVRVQAEPSQLFIDITTPDGRRTGLLHNSTVKGAHLDTVDQRDIVRKIGTFSTALLQRLEDCVKAAVDFS